jgi:eukaryotic-like serine/threonine-protein kinase
VAQPIAIARYRIESLISRGGMGAVYLAFDPELERRVALKLLRDDLDSEVARARFVREARAAARLRHPNIVTIYDFGVHEDHPYLAMEFVPGQTLAKLISAQPPLALPRRLALAEDLCAAVHHAHRMEVVHRDIKPGNVMVDADGVLKVLDFGLARTSAAPITLDGVVAGTPAYMAPEQIAGGPVDHRADIFSTGAVLYELLSLKPAFAGPSREALLLRIVQGTPEPLERLCPQLPPELFGIVRRALARDLDERYQSLRELQDAIARVRGRLERIDDPEQTLPTARLQAPEPSIGNSPTTPVGGGAAVAEQVEVAPQVITTGQFQRALAGVPGEPVSQPAKPIGHMMRVLALAAALAITVAVAIDTRIAPKALEPLPSRSIGVAVVQPLPALRSTLRLASARPRVTSIEPEPEPEPSVPAPHTPQPTPQTVAPVAPPPAPAPVVLVPEPQPVAAAPVSPESRVERREPEPVPTPPSSPAPSPADEIRRVLHGYAAAMSARDLERVAALRILDARTRDRLEALFRGSEYALTLRRVDEPQITGRRAVVRCATSETVVQGGRRTSRPGQIEFVLTEDGGQWRIRELRDR